VAARHPDAERPGANPEAKGWVQERRLAVDTRGNGAIRVDLERGRGPVPPWPRWDVPPLARTARHRDDGDAEEPVVDPGTGA
jgi:hypothetical protein